MNLFGTSKKKVECDDEASYSCKVRKFAENPEIKAKVNAVRPFFIGGLVAWPAFWVYKGLEWPSHRGRETLQVYIRKTFYQAKMIQLVIIASGLILATYGDANLSLKKLLQPEGGEDK